MLHLHGRRRRRCCCRCCLQCSNISDTTGPIKAKLHVEYSEDGGTKVCINGPGHIIKMAVMPMYDKILKRFPLWNQSIDFNSPAGTQDDRAIAPIENVFAEISWYVYPELKSG